MAKRGSENEGKYKVEWGFILFLIWTYKFSKFKQPIRESCVLSSCYNDS